MPCNHSTCTGYKPYGGLPEPRRLSSLIKYGDQLTIKDLKVTGYLNATDIEFIGKLNKDRNLKGTLDLSEVHMVSSTNSRSYTDDVLDYRMFDTSSSGPEEYGDSLVCFKLPKYNKIHNQGSSTNKGYYHCSNYFKSVDTLVFAPVYINYVNEEMIGDKYRNLVLGENIDSIPGGLYYQNLGDNHNIRSVRFSKGIKVIGEDAFRHSSLSSINWNDIKDSLRVLGFGAFIDTKWHPDTLYIPTKIDKWETFSYCYKDGEHIYVGENVNEIDLDDHGTNYVGLNGSDQRRFSLIIHMKSKNPPKLVGQDNSGNAAFNENTIVYVPYGSKETYKNWGMGSYTYKGVVHNSYVNIQEEEPVHVDSVVVAEKEVTLNKIGETYQLHSIIYPANAEIRDLTYTSSNSAVCVVRNDGLVTATGDGKCTIVVSAVDGGLPGICRITVNEETTGISNLESDNNNKPIEIYSINGQRMSKPVKGINIIKQKGQKTKKVILK